MSDEYGWQAIADCPGVPCNKPECIYYDQPDDFTWTCSIPRIQDVAAALVAANARADEAEAMCEWLATDDYIAACPSNAPLHRPLVWSKDWSTVLDGGCGGDAGRCQECRLAAAREAVK